MDARAGIVAMACLAAFAGCAATPAVAPGAAPVGTVPPSMSAEIRLQAGQSTRVDAASFEIAFTGVSADSRCAKGETCIWEGSATVQLTVTGAAGAQELELHTAARSGPSAAAYGGLGDRLVALEPFPVAGREIAPDAYVVTLRIERGACGRGNGNGDAVRRPAGRQKKGRPCGRPGHRECSSSRFSARRSAALLDLDVVDVPADPAGAAVDAEIEAQAHDVARRPRCRSGR